MGVCEREIVVVVGLCCIFMLRECCRYTAMVLLPHTVSHTLSHTHTHTVSHTHPCIPPHPPTSTPAPRETRPSHLPQPPPQQLRFVPHADGSGMQLMQYDDDVIETLESDNVTLQAMSASPHVQVGYGVYVCGGVVMFFFVFFFCVL